MSRFISILIALCSFEGVFGNAPKPILHGFNPDPTICRDGDDYYLVTSSFKLFPALPVYHSRDLVNWELISHGVDKRGVLPLDNVGDNDGVWAPSLRKHGSKWYLSATFWDSTAKSGDLKDCTKNFIVTADHPQGPWSDPVWIKMPSAGVDPQLFWDDDGSCWILLNGRAKDQSGRFPARHGIWLRRINPETGVIFGEDIHLTDGHAVNAKWSEGPHLYKVDGKYYLVHAEGGSGHGFHACIAQTADRIEGPYTPCQVNPFLTNRHLGSRAPLRDVGHIDLTDTPDGRWYAVVLGNRFFGPKRDHCLIGRETFLTSIEFDNGNIIACGGDGALVRRPESPVKLQMFPAKPQQVYIVKVGERDLHGIKVGDPDFRHVEHVAFARDEAFAYYRSAKGYFIVEPRDGDLVLVSRFGDEEKVLFKRELNQQAADIAVEVKSCYVRFFVDGRPFGEAYDTMPICDNEFNRFNGPIIGILRK